MLLGITALVSLASQYSGRPSQAARSTGNDAEWLGHAWVDGRKGQSDVDVLAAQLRGTGIRDLFVHAGPFSDDGSLDPAIRQQAAWLTKALHTALPGVRVQAWLGAHPLPDELHLHSEETRAAVLIAVGQIIDDGFDGIHYDFEPVDDGNDELITILRETRALARQRHVMLSVSAIHGEPWPGMAACVTLMPGRSALWSGGYLRRVALEVDQVAVMAYDTTLPTGAAYGGYVRRVTEIAIAVVPPEVTLFIGVPAYHDQHIRHGHGETVAASLRGIRLAWGAKPPERKFGVAMYVDFAATADDWASYHRDWMSPK
ncbi:MAG TPA: hypothetical protein DGG94_20595 [Micromonosporaceae bacterium]|nr:hypothetical protein [Micromonosporaceae bacterium]HCU52163.1 hypothetical protein [Micromonosporaceae bacterium]